ncbi:hypothetical protein P4O66_003202 [Electrophorus voltai]|uniref:Uncharacterized protein n=1 Tax=Electrophorus voltai TaxID=2609070 RepID=A0AAD8YS31_9TELE|nr:hypothetical protein P4O66_003202 [Electrophorus voltai]
MISKAVYGFVAQHHGNRGVLGPVVAQGKEKAHSDQKHRPMKDAWEGEQKKEGEERKQMPFYNPSRETLHPGLTPDFHNRGGHWTILGGPEYGPGSDSVESYRPQPDYEDWHLEVDSAGCYLDYYEGYLECGDRGECSDVSLQSDLESDYVEDPPMEVEEVLYGDPPTDSDVQSAISKKDEPPVPKIPPKAPPRRYRLGASKLFRAGHLEVTSSEEKTPFTKAHSPGTCAPVPKPHRGKREATPQRRGSVVLVRKWSHMGLYLTTTTGIMISSPRSWTPLTSPVLLRDQHSSWPRSMGPQWGSDPLGSTETSLTLMTCTLSWNPLGFPETSLTMRTSIRRWNPLEGYVEYGEREECSGIALELDMESDREEDSSMEVEEVPHEDPPSQTP